MSAKTEAGKVTRTESAINFSDKKSDSIANLAKAVIATMKEIKGVEKAMKVGSGSYGYQGVSDYDVKKTVGEAMANNGLCVLPIDVQANAQVTRWTEGTSTKQQVFTEATVKYLLMHDSGEWAEVAGYGQGVDSQDKSAGKATTYAEKYLLLYMFLVPTGKIDDADATHSQEMATPKLALPTMTEEQAASLAERMQNKESTENPLDLLTKASQHFTIPAAMLTKLKSLLIK